MKLTIKDIYRLQMELKELKLKEQIHMKEKEKWKDLIRKNCFQMIHLMDPLPCDD